MADKDLYRILGVSKEASAQEIKKSYRNLAHRYHPDQNQGDNASEERFKEISAAFAVLGDEKKRALYDDFGPDGLREGFDPEAARNYQRWAGGFGGGPGGFNINMGPGGFGGFGDLDELLGGLFGGGGMGRGAGHARRQRGADLEGDIKISVRQALEGAEITLPERGGRVRIPKGIADGQKIRLSGQGQQGMAGRGDLYLKVEIIPPPGFKREGDDLRLDLPLRISQAIKGDNLEIPTPEASNIRLRIPAGVQSGQRLRIRGKGLPLKGGRGPLYVRVMIQAPQDSPEARQLAEALDKHYL